MFSVYYIVRSQADRVGVGNACLYFFCQCSKRPRKENMIYMRWDINIYTKLPQKKKLKDMHVKVVSCNAFLFSV